MSGRLSKRDIIAGLYLPAANQRGVEVPASLSPRRRFGSLFLAIAVVFLQIAPVGAYVTSDQPDYSPGSVVTVSGDNSNLASGEGYVAGELVRVDVTGPNGYAASCEGTVDEAGSWSCQITLWNGPEAIGEYSYTATGLTSGVVETGTFTDAANVNTTLTLVLSATNIALGDSVNLSGVLANDPGDPDSADNPLPPNQTITINRYASSGCGGAPTTIFTDTTGNDFNGTFTPATAGTFNIRAVFSGADNGLSGNDRVTWQPANSPCRQLVVDAPPAVSSTSPADGASGVSASANVVITFTEGVAVAAGWFTITCTLSGAHAAAQTGGPTTFTLDPSVNFTAGETCSVTVDDAKVTDTDTADPPNNMAADYVFDFSIFNPNTPPVLTVPTSPVIAEATSPAGANVSFVVTATDAEDNPDPAPVCVPASGSAFGLGDTTVNCSVTDSGGLSDADSFVVRVQDTTDPAVQISTAAVAGGSGWFNVISSGTSGILIDVDVDDAVGATSLACTDDTGGGPVPVPGPLDPTGDSFVIGDGVHSIACTATDASGNNGSDSDSFSVDQTAPDVSVALDKSPDAGTGWFNLTTGAPTAEFTCSDATSDIATCPADHLFGEGEDQSHSGTAFDNAGNSASATVSNVDVDLTAPTSIAFGPTTITQGSSYHFGFVPAGPSTCTANYDISGSAGCVVTGPSNGNAVGPNKYTATATDLAGNAGTFDLNYTVLAWTLQGFFQPVDMGAVYNTVKAGSTVPLKFRIFAGTTEITDLAAVDYVRYIQVTCNSYTQTDAVEELATPGGTELRYTSGQFIDNWKTPSGGTWAGKCLQVQMKAADGSSLYAWFKLK
jgi:Bacterial Ig-like domain